MLNSELSYKDTKYFNSLFCDYLDTKDVLKEFYNNTPELNSFKDQIIEKQSNYDPKFREKLKNIILKQYSCIEINDKLKNTIHSLTDINTFTITTGHQLCLFTGPLYFIYKILTTINLTQKLKDNYPKYNFLPVYWMATEDHDFEEIKSFNFQNSNLYFNSIEKGPVGDISTKEIDSTIDNFASLLPDNNNSRELIELFKSSYLESDNLSQATRKLVHKLFKKYNLIIFDSNSKDLKNIFKPVIKVELYKNLIFNNSKSSINRLVSKGYKIQVNPREINLFYITKGYRSRIIKNKNLFMTDDNLFSWNEDEIDQELSNNPERFSPNVLLRPIFQEYILPNLCYVGGASEISYWLELKNCFDKLNLTYPILLNRNSVLLIESKQLNKLNRLGLDVKDLFLKEHELIAKYLMKLNLNQFNFNEQQNFLVNQFSELRDIAIKTDKSFIGAVNAQEKKQIKGLLNLEKRLLKANKKLNIDKIKRVTKLLNELFPNSKLQERVINFSEFYINNGNDIIDKIYKNLDSLNKKFTIIEV